MWEKCNRQLASASAPSACAMCARERVCASAASTVVRESEQGREGAREREPERRGETEKFSTRVREGDRALSPSEREREGREKACKGAAVSGHTKHVINGGAVAVTKQKIELNRPNKPTRNQQHQAHTRNPKAHRESRYILPHLTSPLHSPPKTACYQLPPSLAPPPLKLRCRLLFISVNSILLFCLLHVEIEPSLKHPGFFAPSPAAAVPFFSLALTKLPSYRHLPHPPLAQEMMNGKIFSFLFFFSLFRR